MGKKKHGIAVSILLIACTCIIYIIRMRETYEISSLLNKFSSGMQIKQIAASYFLFCIGYWELYCANLQWGTLKKVSVGYVLGAAIWGVLSVFYLCIGIEYNLFFMTTGFIFFGTISYIFRRGKTNRRKEDFLYDSIIFIGIASIASTGLLFTIGGGDSQYFIQQWGKDFAIFGEIKDIQHTLLTHTSMFSAMFSSLAYFFGCDNIYTIHHCMEICFWLFFGKTIEESLFIYKPEYSPFKKSILSIFLTLFVYTLPPIRLLSGWIISNMYMMVYMFALCYSLYRVSDKKELSCWEKVFIHIIVISIVLLRADASATICIILGCFAIRYPDKIKQLYPFLLSAFVAFVMYYAKIFVVLKGNINGSFISFKTLLLMGGCFLIIMCYMMVAKYILRVISNKFMIKILYIGLIVFNLVLFLIFRDTYFNNVYTIFQNVVSTNQDGQWGSTFCIIGVCLCYIVSKRKEKDIFFLTGISLVVAYIDFGVLRTINGTSIAARLGYGDSMNRAIISTIPIIFFGFYIQFLMEGKKA